MAISKHFNTILGFIVSVGILYGIWKIVIFFISLLNTADPKVSVAIVGAMTTIFVGLFAVIITQRQIKSREVAEAHRTKKIEIYERFLEIANSTILGASKDSSQEPIPQEKLVEHLFKYKTELILWGSPKVINSQLEFQKIVNINGDVFSALNNLYKAIREDIGLSNKGLNNLQLVKMYLSDPDELDQLVAEKRKK